MAQKIIGIDVGSYSVKVAEVERSFKSFAFTHFYERRIQYNELLAPDESVAIALQSIFDEHDLAWEAACAGVKGQTVSARLLTFPFGSTKKIAQTVTFEMEGHMPFGLDEVLLDYSIIWSTKEASKVLVVYIKKSEFAKQLSTLQTIGVDPRVMGVEGLELVNLVNLGMVPPEGAYAIIDMGHAKTTIAVCQGKKLAFMRSILIGGAQITEAIAARLEVPLEEAERLKVEMGQMPASDADLMDDLSRDVVGAVREVMDALITNIRQTLFTFSDTQDMPVGGVFLCGGTSRLAGLDRALSDALKQNVSYLNVLDFHFSRLAEGEGAPQVMPQALAIALRGVAAGGAHDINFRQGEFAFTGDVEQLGGSMRRVVVAVILIVGLALGYFTMSYYSLKQRLTKEQTDAAGLVLQAVPGTQKKSLKSISSALAIVKSKEAEVKDRVTKLGEITGLSPLEVLKDISEGLPARTELKLDVTALNVGKSRATFSGTVDTFEAVDRVKQALEKSGKFRNVTTGNVRKGVKGEIKFDAAMELGPEPPPDAGK